jgi:hypothetical protein
MCCNACIVTGTRAEPDRWITREDRGLSTDSREGFHYAVNRLIVPAVNTNLGYLIRVNGGIFSRAEALDCGETDRTLAEARCAGVIVRLRRGMYAPADIYEACDDSGKHLLHARAALAAQKGPVALTGASAAALHGFALYQQDLSIVHILRLDQGASRRKALTNHHIVIKDIDSELGQYDGIVAVSPARAVWEVACRSTMESGVVTADSALRKAPQLANEIEELQEKFAYFPGSRQGRITIGFADGRSDSPGESVTRVQFHRYGIPIPDLQYDVIDDQGNLIGTSDFYWKEYRHLGEFDGKIKYQKLLRAGETPSDCVFREKRREDAMRADLRGMTRFTWSMVMPDTARKTMADLARALDQSYRLYVRGRRIIAG